MNVPAHCAGLIDRLRHAGLTLSEIPERSGISRAHLWRMLVGDSHEPLYRTVRKLEDLADEVTEPQCRG